MHKKTDIVIEDSWKKVLADEFVKPYFVRLREAVRSAYLTKTIFPRPADLFAAFRETPWEDVRVVLLGQDPYHGYAELKMQNAKFKNVGQVQEETQLVPQAMGLCFSVREGVPPPPSLQNIFKEVNANRQQTASLIDNRHQTADETDLTRWARQGVLLLNSVLTVEAGKAGSHAALGKEKNADGTGAGGWEQFTDAVIQKISAEKTGVVFLLWGNYARGKKKYIDTTKHLVLEAPHPSPLSAHAGFFGCGHFTKVNDYVRRKGEKEIVW